MTDVVAARGARATSPPLLDYRSMTEWGGRGRWPAADGDGRHLARPFAVRQGALGGREGGRDRQASSLKRTDDRGH